MAETTARTSAPVITGNPLLQVRELHAWYDESHVLHGVDFDVRPGEVVTLLGRNGAGKTTTLKSVMGIVGKRLLWRDPLIFSSTTPAHWVLCLFDWLRIQIVKTSNRRFK